MRSCPQYRFAATLFLCLVASSCTSDGAGVGETFRSLRGIVANPGNNQQFYNEDGIDIEEIDFKTSGENPYNTDNSIYTEGKTWKYNFSYAKDNKRYVLEVNDRGKWRTVNPNTSRQRNWKRVTGLFMQVIEGFGPYEEDKTFNKTVIKYFYELDYRRDENEMYTSVVENQSNVWNHPLRKDLFEILALNPYPFVKYPLETGNRFKFELPVNESWGNPEWKKWYGKLKNNCRYEIVKQKTLPFSFGDLSTHVTLSNCENELGDTGLISYFNRDYGFVKLDYRNIDNSWISFELAALPN